MDPILAGTAAIAILGATTVIQSIRLRERRAAQEALYFNMLRVEDNLKALQDKERKRLKQIHTASLAAKAKRDSSKAQREAATLDALKVTPLRPREDVVADTPRRLAKAAK